MAQRQKILNRFLLMLLLIGTYYYIYRYPLKINDANISASGYASTPLALALGKYILVSLVLLYIGLWKIFVQQRIRKHRSWTSIAYCYLGFIPILYGLLQGDLIDIESGIFWIVALWLNVWFVGELVVIIPIVRFIHWAIYISILVDLIQIALYLLVGRLPALAFAGTTSIRFGSIMDDPNGFGLLLSLFFGFSFVYYTGLQRYIILASLLLMLILTQSLTGLAAAAGAITVYGLCYLYHRPQRFALNILLVIPVALFVLLGIAFNLTTIIDTLTDFFTTKAGSIAQHAESVTQIFELDLSTLVGLSPRGHVGESGYVNYLANYGIFYLLVYIAVGIKALYHYYVILFRTKSDTPLKAIASGIFTYLIAVILANINLPLREIFPHNLYVPLFLGLASSHTLWKPLYTSPLYQQSTTKAQGALATTNITTNAS